MKGRFTKALAVFAAVLTLGLTIPLTASATGGGGDFKEKGSIKIVKDVKNENHCNKDFNFKVTSADGTITQEFTLKDGGSKQFTGSLPVGTYYVDELNIPNGYIRAGFNREIVVKEADKLKTVTVTNVNTDEHKGNLTVMKVLSGSALADVPDNATFTFKVKGFNFEETFSLTKADLVAGKNSFTFANLSTRCDYTVTETASYSSDILTKTVSATVKVGDGAAAAATLEDNGLSLKLEMGKTSLVTFTNAYEPEDQTVTVNYYQDSLTGTLLGIGVFSTTAHIGDVITLAAGTTEGKLDFKKPATAYNSGTQMSAPYTVVDGTNTINVVYVKKDLAVTVNYYKGSVAAANLLGSSTYTTTAHVGDIITLISGTAASQLDYKKPASGFTAGAQQGVPYTVVDSATNVVNVVYYAIIADQPIPKTGDNGFATIAAVMFSLFAMTGGAFVLKKAIKKR